MIYKKTAITLVISLGFISFATFASEDARVLPVGRHRFSFNYGQATGISQTFNEQGQKVGITDPYKVSLDAATLKTVDEGMGDLINLLNATGYHYDASHAGNPSESLTRKASDPMLGDALSKGFIDVGAEAKRTQYTFQLQRGFTDRLSAGFMIPIVKTQVRTQKQIAGTNQTVSDALAGMQGAANVPNLNQIVEGLNMINNADINTLQGLLESRDYQRYGDYEGSGIGDITIGGRYLYYKTRSEDWINSVQATLTAPTGELKPTGSLTQTDNGQGTWDFSLGHVFNWNPTILSSNKLMFSHSVNYKHRLPGHRPLRVRESPTDFLPNAASEEDVWMQLGDKFWTVVGGNYAFTKAINFDVNYEFYWKGSDRYAGSRVKDYSYLSEDTTLYLETASFSLNFNTIHSFLQGGFPIPGSLSISHYRPMRGKNTIIAPFWAAEVAMYF